MYCCIDGGHHLHLDPDTAPTTCELTTRFLRACAAEDKGSAAVSAALLEGLPLPHLVSFDTMHSTLGSERVKLEFPKAKL